MAAILSGTMQAFSSGAGVITLTNPNNIQSYHFRSAAAADAAFKFSNMPNILELLLMICWQCGRAQGVTLPALATWSYDPTLVSPFTVTFSALNPANEIG